MNAIGRIISLRNVPLLGRVARGILLALGLSVPPTVQIGENLKLPHNSFGLVLHQDSVIGDNVTLYQNVTLGRADVHLPEHLLRPGGGISIGDNAIIGAGAAVLFRSGSTLRIGQGAMVGANAVVLTDIQDHEVWAGNPARLVATTAGNDGSNFLHGETKP
ncbi:serine O-acetyltransferase [Arthrobacter sp. TMS1-12-1]